MVREGAFSQSTSRIKKLKLTAVGGTKAIPHNFVSYFFYQRPSPKSSISKKVPSLFRTPVTMILFRGQIPPDIYPVWRRSIQIITCAHLTTLPSIN
jgi:hypothetical protein